MSRHKFHRCAHFGHLIPTAAESHPSCPAQARPYGVDEAAQRAVGITSRGGWSVAGTGQLNSPGPRCDICPIPARAAACRDVEAAILAHDGSPPITRTTFPTCRAHYPGGSNGCACRLLPRSCSLPQMAGGSASALSLSRPAQASHVTARRIAQPPRGDLCHEAPALPVTRPSRSSATGSIDVESSSTGDPRLRGALPIADMTPCSARAAPLPSHCKVSSARRSTGARVGWTVARLHPITTDARTSSIGSHRVR
jgi:hypothetical protein